MSRLIEFYDALVCDLDGVVYRGPTAVEHAVDALSLARSEGTGVAYATNNASRPPALVADHLRELGLDLDDADVVNSSQAGATHLAEALGRGACVLGVGGPGVRAALQEQGLVPVAPGEHADAVLQGYGADVTAGELAEAAYAIQAGATWVATNTDRTLPTDRGTAPGNGTLVEAVRTAVGEEPEVVGKPGPLMYRLAASRLGAEPARTLGIGDRLETDVAGAHAAGMDALHVLTGVHGPSDLVRAPRHLRPRWVATDLRALHEPVDEPVRDRDGWILGGHHARLVDGEVVGSARPGSIEGLRLALAVLWSALDDRVIETGAAERGIGVWSIG